MQAINISTVTNAPKACHLRECSQASLASNAASAALQSPGPGRKRERQSQSGTIEVETWHLACTVNMSRAWFLNYRLSSNAPVHAGALVCLTEGD